MKLLRPPGRRPLTFRRDRSRWRRFGVPIVLLVLVVGSLGILGYASGAAAGLGGFLFEARETPPETGSPPADRAEARPAEAPPEPAPKEPVPERPEPYLEPPPESSPEAAAYLAAAPDLPGLEPGSVEGVYRSAMDPTWASVRISPEGEESTYFVFVRRGDDGSWRALKSIRADEPAYPENEWAVLGGVPEDLVRSVYLENVVEPVKPGPLPEAAPAGYAPAEPVADGVPEAERGRADEGLEEMRRLVEEYQKEHGGIAGVYVRDLEGGWGYGVRPDEPFFAASVIKVPIMVAVFRRIEQGELSLDDTLEIAPEDWAAGAGWMQFEPAGTTHTVRDHLVWMMTESDNVATNALTRRVGGPEYVNEVARSMGAKDTLLYQKVTSERAIVPGLDNRTTPRDMAAMMEQIAAGRAASPESCRAILDLMYENDTDRWLEAGLPQDIEAANKTGWLYKVYNDVGVVERGERRYAVAILAKHGPEDVEAGKALIGKTSQAVWEAQSHP